MGADDIFAYVYIYSTSADVCAAGADVNDLCSENSEQAWNVNGRGRNINGRGRNINGRGRNINGHGRNIRGCGWNINGRG
jgi:hypothetical protein